MAAWRRLGLIDVIDARMQVVGTSVDLCAERHRF